MFIRPMLLADAAAVAELYTQLGYPAPVAAMERRIAQLAEDCRHLAFVAVGEERRVIGCIQVQGRHLLESEPFAEIAGLVVAQGWRGQGVGRALVARAEAWARPSACARTRRGRRRIASTSAPAIVSGNPSTSWSRRSARAPQEERTMDLYVREADPAGASTIVFRHGGDISGWMWVPPVAGLECDHCC